MLLRYAQHQPPNTRTEMSQKSNRRARPRTSGRSSRLSIFASTSRWRHNVARRLPAPVRGIRAHGLKGCVRLRPGPPVARLPQPAQKAAGSGTAGLSACTQTGGSEGNWNIQTRSRCLSANKRQQNTALVVARRYRTGGWVGSKEASAHLVWCRRAAGSFGVYEVRKAGFSKGLAGGGGERVCAKKECEGSAAVVEHGTELV